MLRVDVKFQGTTEVDDVVASVSWLGSHCGQQGGCQVSHSWMPFVHKALACLRDLW